MKKMILFLLFPCFSLLDAQEGFINITGNDTFPETFGDRLHAVFRQPGIQKNLTLFTEDLDSLGKYDLSALQNLEVVVIKFSFDPEKGDTARISFVEKSV